MIRRSCLGVLSLVFILAIFASSAFAQGGRAELIGVVLDQGKPCCPASPSA